MTTSLAGPGPIRLQREAVRIVSIPYATPFSKTGDKLNLGSAVTYGMGSDAIVKKRTLKLRLEAPGVGFWKCPRKSDGHKGKEVHHLSKQEAPRSPGYCQIEDPEGHGGKCGRKLVPEETHWHEMAEAFGFLESQGDSYIYGKFGQLAKYLSEIERTQTSYFDFDKARLALSLDSLLENHSDFVLPVLWTADNPDNHGSSLDKYCSWKLSSVAYALRKLSTKIRLIQPMGLLLCCARRRTTNCLHSTLLYTKVVREVRCIRLKNGICTCRRLLSSNVQAAYVARTRTYLRDLSVIAEVSSQKGAYQLTDLGRNLVAELKYAGFMVSDRTCHIPPGFEAIHDVLSVGIEQYSSSFTPPFSRQILEHILMRSLLPLSEPVAWDRHRDDLARILPSVVQSVGSKINDGARIDTVRGAVFLYQIGRGLPTILEDAGHHMDNDDSGVRRNAIISLAAAYPDNYLLGSARVGRRLWSINLLRNPSHSA